MSTRTARVAAILVALALSSAACADDSSYEFVEPASVEEVSDGLWSITLTERAAQRTGLETAPVAMEDVDGSERLVVPYSAVMYHYDGTTWSYERVGDLTYERRPIEIDYVDGDTAVLLDGPEPGTEVVAVGAAELYGVEFGIGK